MDCNGKKISELEERVDLTGNEYIVFQDDDWNGKASIRNLVKNIGEGVTDTFDATATATSGDTPVAKVTLENNTFKFAFQLPRGEKGADGQSGQSTLSARQVFAFKQSDTQPVTPTGGSWDVITNTITYPTGWSESPAIDGIVWMSETTFYADGSSDEWSTPIRVTGKDGENGVDGSTYQYIYTRTKTTTDRPTTPVSSQVDEVPQGWYDNPQGITEEYKVEWVCMRFWDREEGLWGDYTNPPVIWSRWGENGKDGDGVEYIFTRTKNEVAPPQPVQSENVDEYIPPTLTDQGQEEQWHDDPWGVNNEWRYEYVSMRKQASPESASPVWGQWSKPALWAYKAKDGVDGVASNYNSFFFKNSEEKPAQPTFTNPNAPTDGWVDSIAGEGNWWCCIAKVDGLTNTIVEWGTVFSMTGVMFRNISAYKSTGTSDVRPATPVGGSWDPTNDEIVYPDGWSSSDELGGIVWESNATFTSLGNQTHPWTTPFRITGDKGENGKDGTNIEFIYTVMNTDATPELNVEDSANENDYLPGDNGQVGSNPKPWKDNPYGITEEWYVEWSSQRRKNPDTGVWENWSEPVRWSRWGRNGRDGDGVEYIFVRTTREQAPTRPTDSPNIDEYLPDINPSESSWVEGPAWVDDPSSPTTTYPYVYVSMRKQSSPEDASATWGAWSDPALWAMYGHTGDSIEFRVRAHDSASTPPPLDRDARHPDGWSINTADVTSTNKYVWMTYARINTQDELVGEWATPWNTTGEDGQSGGGGTGDPGPQGATGLPGVGMEIRYSIGTETEPDATWNSTVRTTRDPSSYGWTTLYPQVTEEKPKMWFIQARIGYRYEETPSAENPNPDVVDYLEDGEWTAPSVYGGVQGTDGVGISATNVWYALTMSTESVPDKDGILGGLVWKDTPAETGYTGAENQVLWWMIVTVYTNNREDRSEPAPVIPGKDGENGQDGTPGQDGAPGEDGIGFKEVYEEYYLSNSPTELSGGEWSKTYPGWSDGLFLWVRTTFVYSDDTAEHPHKWSSEPVCISGPQGPAGSSGEGTQGPIVYPAGVYDINKTYYGDTKKAPYVFDPTDLSDYDPEDPTSHKGNYYFLNMSSGSWTGNLQDEDNQYPSQNATKVGAVWVKIEAFDAMYAEIGILGNALVGSAVFNGNYMFSQQGYSLKFIEGMVRIDTTHYENFDPEIASWYLHKEGDVKIITNESDLTTLDMSGSSKGEVVVYAHSTSSAQVFTYYKYLGTGTGAERFKNVGDLTVAQEGEDSTYTGPFLPNILIDFRRGELFLADNAAFRVDGSGHLAGKGISWDKEGNISSQGMKATEADIQGKITANEGTIGDLTISNGDLIVNTTTSNIDNDFVIGKNGVKYRREYGYISANDYSEFKLGVESAHYNTVGYPLVDIQGTYSAAFLGLQDGQYIYNLPLLKISNNNSQSYGLGLQCTGRTLIDQGLCVKGKVHVLNSTLTLDMANGPYFSIMANKPYTEVSLYLPYAVGSSLSSWGFAQVYNIGLDDVISIKVNCHPLSSASGLCIYPPSGAQLYNYSGETLPGIMIPKGRTVEFLFTVTGDDRRNTWIVCDDNGIQSSGHIET